MKKLLLALLLTQLAWSLPPSPEEEDGFGPPPPPPGLEMAGDRFGPPEGKGPRMFQRRTFMGPGMNSERVLEFLQKNYPERAQELNSLKSQKPEEYRRTLAGLQREVGPLLRLQNGDPQRFAERLAEFKVNDKVRNLTRTYREAPAAQKSSLREQLKPLLEQQFQTRQKREKERLQHLKEMTRKMEARLNEREAKKTEIIQHHLEELTTGQELRW
ncbi:MAG: hypothetical protein KF760_25635 [Candidatus Eremiobacteraeota bacterium]|nr:hypothetical protein [Candidatus Eremiobacteraeota bacterium]MCW5866860.1 hypothetical protein [Candidatus Eremiobacteraeota bacterium]